MIKYIILGIIIYIVYLFFFRAKRQHVASKSSEHVRKASETMVECSKCSVFVSPKEAILKDGKFYCSKECAKA